MNVRTTVPEMDIEFTIRALHKPGVLASILSDLGKTSALVGDISTVRIGKTFSLRKIVISVYDESHLIEVIDVINANEMVELVEKNDIVFQRHKEGKIRSKRVRDIETITDLRYIYTPGVARVCTLIHQDIEKAKEYTSIGNSVGIFTNGTRVLGLGDIGPEASMPVMEGKAVIYDQFVGLNATPILIQTKDAKEFVETVVNVSPSFGAIHLEDIRMPDCFYIEDELKKRLKKPVMHDDQHGTGTVTLAAIMTILRLTEKRLKDDIVIAQVGLGAAGFGIASLLYDWGADVIGVDPNEGAQKRFTDYGGRVDTLENAMQHALVVITTTGVVGLIQPKMIKKGQIVLSLSNPQPEIKPEEALVAGAIFAADGKTINNALAYPGLFKGALNIGARSISSEMKIRTAEVIAQYAEDDELVPSPLHPSVHSSIIEAIEKLHK